MSTCAPLRGYAMTVALNHCGKQFCRYDTGLLQLHLDGQQQQLDDRLQWY